MTASTLTTPFDFAKALLSVCDVALAATAAGAPGRSYVSPGLPALDCEQVTVSPVSLEQGPTQPLTGMAAGRRLSRGGYVNEFGFAITVARDCMPVVGAAGTFPATADLEAAASILTEDVWAIWNAIDGAFRTGALFEGRCSFLFLDAAFALATSGAIGGWQLNLKTQIDGITQYTAP